MFVSTFAVSDIAAAGISLAVFPTDPASVFVYLLVAASAYLVWRGSRGSGAGGGKGPSDE